MKVIKALLTSSLIASAMLTGCADKKPESSAPKNESSANVSDGITADTETLKSKYNVNARYGNSYTFDTPS